MDTGVYTGLYGGTFYASHSLDCCSSALWPMCLPGDKSSSDPIKETSREGGATAMYREGTEDGPVTICMEKPLEEEGPLCPMKRLQDDAA